MNDIETRGADLEGVRVDRPSRQRLAKARAYTRDISIPRMDHPTYSNIRASIERLISEGKFGNIQINFGIRPSTDTVVNVKMDFHEDQTEQLAQQMRSDIRR